MLFGLVKLIFFLTVFGVEANISGKKVGNLNGLIESLLPAFSNLELNEIERLFDQVANKSIERLEQQLNQPTASLRSKRAHPFSPDNINTSKYGTIYQPNSPEFLKWYNESLSLCQNSLNSLINVSKLESIVKDVYYIDQPEGITVQGDVTFDSLTVTDTLTSSDVVSFTNYSHSKNLDISLETINHNLNLIRKGVNQLNQILANALKTDGVQKVTGNINFENVYLKCPNGGCNIRSIETATLNGRDVRDLSSRVIKLNKDQHLVDHFNFSSVVATDFQVNFINNIEPKDIVTRDDSYVINGQVKFEGPVTVGNLTVIKDVNGKIINRNTVLTATDSQVISTPIVFTRDVSIKDLHVEGKLAQIDRDVNTFLSSIVQVDANRTITGKKIFNSLNIEKLSLLDGTLNRVDMNYLGRQLLTSKEGQNIQANWSVDELIIKGDLDVQSINGELFSDTIVNKYKPVVRGDVIFTGPVSMQSMDIVGTLNGRSVADKSLGILLKTGSQVITGRKVFSNITASNVAIFHGDIGELKFDQLESKMKKMINGGKDRTLTGPIKLESIKVEGLINGINLTSLMNDYLKINQSVVPNINLNISTATFKSSLKCDTINGLRLPKDFITLHTDQYIPGEVHMSNNLIINSDLNITRINGYTVNSILWDSLRSHGDQLITAPKTIKGNLYVKKLNVSMVNNIKMKDLVLLNGSGAILGNKMFNKIDVTEHGTVNSVKGVKSINGIPVDELFRNSITRKGYQSISAKVHVKKLIIPHDTNINITELAGIRLNDILSSVIYLRSNETQVIRGRKRFTGHTTFGNLEFYNTFAGYTRDQFDANYFKAKSSEIQANIIINSDLIVDEDLIVTGKLNELHIGSLFRHLPVDDKPIIINRPVKLRYVRVIGGNVESPSINGLQFGKEMLTRKSSIQLKGDVTFLHGLTVDNLSIGSTINNISIAGSICSPIQNVFTYPYTITITGDVTANSDVNAESVNRINFNVSSINRALGPKRFKKLIVKGPISLSGHLNNFDLNYLQRSYLSLTRDQTFESEVFLRTANFSGPVKIEGNLEGKAVYINGVELRRLEAQTLKTTGDQHLTGAFNFQGKAVFRRGLYTSPFISLNHTLVNLARDVFLKNRPNQVNSTLIFRNISTYDLMASLRSNFNRHIRTLETFSSSIQYHGSKNFTTLEVDDLEVNSIDGIKVSSLLRKDTGSTINSTVVFKNGLQIRNNLTILGTINGIKLNELASKLVLAGSNNNTIEASLTFKSKPEITKLDYPQSRKRHLETSLEEAKEKIRSLKRKIDLNQVKLREISAYFKGRNVSLT